MTHPADLEPNNFEWLKGLAKLVKTEDFVHLGSGGSVQDAYLETWPKAYLNFISEFGASELFREYERGHYFVRIWRQPLAPRSESGGTFYEVGTNADRGGVFLRRARGGIEDGVFASSTHGNMNQISTCFETWLMELYGKYWKGAGAKNRTLITKGFPPFNAEEMRIVEAAAKYQVALSGVDDRGNLILEIHNGSEMVLPYLTIAYRLKNGAMSQSPIRVQHIAPSESRIVVANCHRDFINKSSVTIEKPRLQPQMRNFAYEIGGPDWFKSAVAGGRQVGSERIE